MHSTIRSTETICDSSRDPLRMGGVEEPHGVADHSTEERLVNGDSGSEASPPDQEGTEKEEHRLADAELAVASQEANAVELSSGGGLGVLERRLCAH